MSSDGEELWFGVKLGLVWASPFWIIQLGIDGTLWGGHVGIFGVVAFFAGIFAAIQ